MVISSFDRAEVLHETVLSLGKQTLSPAEIILSLCDSDSVLPETASLPLVRLAHGAQGLTAQRNTGGRLVSPGTKYVLFLDDDTELAPNYLENMEGLLDRRPEVMVASGVSAADGLRIGRALAREEAQVEARAHRCASGTEPAEGAYGCNMFVRRSILDLVKFDEGLPLEGWLEDFDFSVRCRRYGLVVWNRETCVAHLGVQRMRRERGFPVGYSQIANSYYLWRKDVIPSFRKLLADFWLPALRVSLQGTIRGRPPWNVTFDYPGRLRGNLLALADAARLRLAPSRILELRVHVRGASDGSQIG